MGKTSQLLPCFNQTNKIIHKINQKNLATCKSHISPHMTDSSVTSSSDVTRRLLLLVARRIYVLFAVIHIIQSLLVWFVRAGSI